MSSRRRKNREKKRSNQATALEEFVLAVDTPEFEAFEIKMDEQLEALVARWQHTAAPAAARSTWRFVAFPTARQS